MSPSASRIFAEGQFFAACRQTRKQEEQNTLREVFDKSGRLHEEPQKQHTRSDTSLLSTEEYTGAEFFLRKIEVRFKTKGDSSNPFFPNFIFLNFFACLEASLRFLKERMLAMSSKRRQAHLVTDPRGLSLRGLPALRKVRNEPERNMKRLKLVHRGINRYLRLKSRFQTPETGDKHKSSRSYPSFMIQLVFCSRSKSTSPSLASFLFLLSPVLLFFRKYRLRKSSK